jgi:hypothetical protein
MSERELSPVRSHDGCVRSPSGGFQAGLWLTERTIGSPLLLCCEGMCCPAPPPRGAKGQVPGSRPGAASNLNRVNRYRQAALLNWAHQNQLGPLSGVDGAAHGFSFGPYRTVAFVYRRDVRVRRRRVLIGDT